MGPGEVEWGMREEASNSAVWHAGGTEGQWSALLVIPQQTFAAEGAQPPSRCSLGHAVVLCYCNTQRLEQCFRTSSGHGLVATVTYTGGGGFRGQKKSLCT